VIAEIRSDRCPGWPDGWERAPNPSGRPDPLFGGTLDGIDVCPGCQTPEERADFLLRDVVEALADEDV
jgi:hypothetical protein